jgi:hypothetical protein
VKTEILSAENKWQQIQFNEKIREYRKRKLEIIVKYNLLGLNFKTKTMQFPLPNWVVNIGQDAQWNVNKHKICKLSITDCVFLEIFDFDY